MIQFAQWIVIGCYSSVLGIRFNCKIKSKSQTMQRGCPTIFLLHLFTSMCSVQRAALYYLVNAYNVHWSVRCSRFSSRCFVALFSILVPPCNAISKHQAIWTVRFGHTQCNSMNFFFLHCSILQSHSQQGKLEAEDSPKTVFFFSTRNFFWSLLSVDHRNSEIETWYQKHTYESRLQRMPPITSYAIYG